MAIFGTVEVDGLQSYFGECSCGQWFCNTHGWERCYECMQRLGLTRRHGSQNSGRKNFVLPDAVLA